MTSLDRTQSGFTLVELVVTLLITSILASFLANIIAQPMRMNESMARRAALIDVTDHALRRMGREIRAALPNSVRVTSNGGDEFLEYLHTVDAGLYRSKPETVPGHTMNDALDVDNLAETFFQSLGNLQHVIDRYDVAAAGNNTLRIAIYNVNNTDIYAHANPAVPGAGLISPPGLQIVSGGGVPEDDITLPAYDFLEASPYHRFFIVDYPATFHCSPTGGGGNGLLRMLSHYDADIGNPQPDVAATIEGFAGVRTAVLANNVSSCNFGYDDATNSRSGLVDLELVLTDNYTGNSVRLIHLIHVESAP